MNLWRGISDLPVQLTLALKHHQSTSQSDAGYERNMNSRCQHWPSYTGCVSLSPQQHTKCFLCGRHCAGGLERDELTEPVSVSLHSGRQKTGASLEVYVALPGVGDHGGGFLVGWGLEECARTLRWANQGSQLREQHVTHAGSYTSIHHSQREESVGRQGRHEARSWRACVSQRRVCLHSAVAVSHERIGT
jgi:hypothetical protein